mgnify:CR=1 FL=1
MPAQLTKGKVQICNQVSEPVLTAFRAHLERKGEKMTAALERLMAADMDRLRASFSPATGRPASTTPSFIFRARLPRIPLDRGTHTPAPDAAVSTT